MTINETRPALEKATKRPQDKRRPFSSVLNIEEFEPVARRKLPRMLYGFISGSVETGAAQRRSAEAYARYAFVPRALVDVSARSQSCTLLGESYAAPFGIPPMACAAIVARGGDLLMARAAAEANIPYVVSGSSLTKLETVRRDNSRAWFQGYLAGDFGRLAPMLDRVAAGGYQTLVVAVDVPVAGNRENNVRSGFSLPLRVTPRAAWDSLTHPRWFFGVICRTLLADGMLHFENNDAFRGPPLFSNDWERNFSRRDALSWEHLKFIRERWKGRLVIKGLLSPEDVRIAVDCGVDGVILSNHGGRTLDYAIAPLAILPEIAAKGYKIPLMIDGGIRRGTDVLKALALGAAFVFVGRPFMYALAAGGIAGVGRVAELLKEEIDRDMALLGMTRLDQVSSACLRREDA